ncbi:hypothetical protein, partial [Crocosphaera sp.]|uniref:hypothetical protein n=1 Tax=Crocosphaera sp. TaxID=2729996 RepID=UPI00257C1138
MFSEFSDKLGSSEKQPMKSLFLNWTVTSTDEAYLAHAANQSANTHILKVHLNLLIHDIALKR